MEVEGRSVSGKLGLYTYTVETSEYNGETLLIGVNKSFYENINEGDCIKIEIQEGLLGYHYYRLLGEH